MSTYQQFLGKFQLTNSEKDFVINDGGGDQTVALTVGFYFIADEDSLCTHMTGLIQALGGNYAGMTVAYDADTGLITIDCDGTTTGITWTDTGLRDLLGFTANLSGATSYTGTHQARYVWRPSRAITGYPAAMTYPEGPLVERSTTRLFRANDGTLRSIEGSLLYDGSFRYENLTKAEVITSSSTVWETLQQFWKDVVHKGMVINFYPNRTQAADREAVKWIPFGDEETIGSFADYIERFTPNYMGLWDLDFSLWKNV